MSIVKYIRNCFSRRADDEELTLEDMKNDPTYIEMIKMVDTLGGRLTNGERIITV